MFQEWHHAWSTILLKLEVSVFSPLYYCIFQYRYMMQNFSLSTGINKLKLYLHLRNRERVELRLQLVALQCLRKPTCTEHFLELNIVGWIKTFDPVNWEFTSASEHFAGFFLSVWETFCFPWRWVNRHKPKETGATNQVQNPCDGSSSRSVFSYQSPGVWWVSNSRYVPNKEHWLKQQLMRLTALVSQGFMGLPFYQ